MKHDIGLFLNATLTVESIETIIKNMSLEQKFKLLTESAKPEPTYQYPETCIRGKMRKFTNSWLQKYPGWLAYSMALDSVFCVPCAIFAENRAGKGKLVNYPFNDWSKLTEKLDNHCKAKF